MSQPAHNLNRQSKLYPRASSEPSQTSITSPRSALPVPILAGAKLVDVKSDRHQIAATCQVNTESRATASRTSSFEQDSLWSKQLVPLKHPNQGQTFETSRETPVALHEIQAQSALGREPARAAAVPVLTIRTATCARTWRQNQASNGSQAQAELMRYPTTRSPFAASKPNGPHPQLPIVVNRAVPEYCNLFSRHANLDLELSSARRSRTALNIEPGIGGGGGPAGAEPLIGHPPSSPSAAEVQCAPSAQFAPSLPTALVVPPDPATGGEAAPPVPITHMTPPDTVITAQAWNISDAVDVAEPHHLRHQAGRSTGFHSRVGTTNLASNTDQYSALEDGFRTPPGPRSILPSRILRAPVQSALQSHPVKTSDLSTPSQLDTSSTRPIPRPLLHPKRMTAPTITPPPGSSVISEKCQMTPPGTIITTVMDAQPSKTQDEEGDGAPPVIPSLDHRNGEVDSLPASPQSEGGSADNEYETPMTSPCSSHVKGGRAIYHYPLLKFRTRQLDGARESSSDGEASQDMEADCQEAMPAFPNANNEPAMVTEQLSPSLENLESVSLESKVDGISNKDDGIGSPASTGSHASQMWHGDSPAYVQEITPLGPPSPAKSLNAFPFPSSASNGVSTRPLSTSRRPSALLRQCERNATPRQRHLMTSGIKTPDRFISSRAGTPTRETLLLAMPRARLDRSDKHVLSADPFGPLPSRSLRIVERYTTTRSPPTPSRPVGMTASRVHDARIPPARAASAGTVWTVGGSVVTEGVASISNGRGGRVTSGTSASHYTADFLRKNSPSEEEVTHGRRLALAMEIDQGAKMLDHTSPSSPRSSQSPSNGGSSTTRTWKNGRWEQDGVPTRL